MIARFRLSVYLVVSAVAASSASSNPGSQPPGAAIRGKVEVIDKGGVKRDRIEDVLVFLEGAGGEIPHELLQQRFSLTSRDKTFEPHVVVVPVGATMSFPNVDDIMHNVFSLSRGNRFDLGLYKSGAKKDFVFENPGLVRIYCNIHPQMSAFVQVRDDPYYAWVGPDGAFEIPGVPPGPYVLKVWSEEGETETKIQVTESGTSGLAVQLDASRYKRRPHLNKFGKPYKRKRGKY